MGNIDSSLPYRVENSEDCNISNEFWSVNKCSFNGFNKNSIIFSYDDKDRLRSDFNFALNQIKVFI